ncbi:MAG: hypothetical protein AB7O04_05645 [Hyphomonadaceae bacterium]
MPATNTVMHYRLMRGLIAQQDAIDGNGDEAAHALLHAALTAALNRLGPVSVRRELLTRQEFGLHLHAVRSDEG